MEYFFSCDWGTSAFRLKLVRIKDLTVLSAIKTDHGIAVAFNHWNKVKDGEENRAAFYKDYIMTQVKKIAAAFGDLPDAPVIISGMASSTLGMMELPYKELPFSCDGNNLITQVIAKDENGDYEMVLVSGARSADDVIRGEETMLIGCKPFSNEKEHCFIFPGTHSKHLMLEHGFVKSIITYMTGELFDLLSNKSILAASVKRNNLCLANEKKFFIQGVMKGAASGFTNSIFHVRTNQLFKKATPEENYQYLSGLLIGHELKGIAGSKPAGITLVCSEELKLPYMLALHTLGLSDQVNHCDAEEALVNGQWKIIEQLFSCKQ